jgi:hypothetical protein
MSIVTDINFSYVKVAFKSFLIVMFLISLTLLFPRELKYLRGTFKFTNNNIYYQKFKNNINSNYTETLDECMAQSQYIKQISFCVMTELYKRYGRKHYLSSWGLFRKSTIAIPLTKFSCFTCYILVYIFILPIKIYKLKKPKSRYPYSSKI